MADSANAMLALVRAASGAHVPFRDGQVIIRTDTGTVEADIGGGRIVLSGIEGVDSLPSAPLDRLYLCGGAFWAHDGTSWVRICGRPRATAERTVAGEWFLGVRDGDIQTLRLAADTYFRLPEDMEAGDVFEAVVTGTDEHSFSIGRTSYGGPRTLPRHSAWLLHLLKDGTGTVRVTAVPCEPPDGTIIS